MIGIFPDIVRDLYRVPESFEAAGPAIGYKADPVEPAKRTWTTQAAI